MTTTRNTKRDTSYDQWALDHYKAPQHLLDLSYHSFYWFTGSGRVTKWHLDESFKTKLLPFMRGIGSFLDEYSNITAFSLNNMKNYYWEPNIEIPQLIANPRLTSLDLGETGITEEDITGLLDKPSLKELSLSGNKLENLAFTENRNLKTLYVANNKLTPDAVSAITKLENLESLDISKNPLNDKLAGELLTKLTHLKSINLENTKITKETAKALLNNKQLTDINVSCGEVGCWNAFQLWRHASKNAKQEAKLSKSQAALFNAGKLTPAVEATTTARLAPK